MNRVDRIDQLRNAGIEASTILDEMTKHFSEDDIEKFYDEFVRLHEVTFGDEDEEPTRCKDCGNLDNILSDSRCLPCRAVQEHAKTH